jgi:hypothetical protein
MRDAHEEGTAYILFLIFLVSTVVSSSPFMLKIDTKVSERGQSVRIKEQGQEQ